jgi:hypothetical protein
LFISYLFYFISSFFLFCFVLSVFLLSTVVFEWLGVFILLRGMASFDSGEIHGLAGEIRTALESDQYDLGGYNEVRAYDLIHNAFGTPLPAPTKMIKCQFVVGGGKLVRSRYDDDLPKWLIAALREIGYTEDRSAAETFDSQGTYKQQHDTGQNLKYLIIYPRVACASAPAAAGSTNAAEASMMDEHSPEYVALVADKATFQDMVGAKVTSYAQKKKLLKFLQGKYEEFKKIEEKLVSGAQLSSVEQHFYDCNSGADEEKIVWLQNEIKLMVDRGELTSREKTDLLRQIDTNIASIQTELDEARTENKPKKVEKLEVKLTALQQRKTMVQAISLIAADLPNSADIQKLYLKMFPLQALEEKSRSISLTLADLKQLELKSDLEAEIKALQTESRGWFQDEDDFQERCAAVENAARVKYRTKSAADAKKKPTGGSSLGGASKPGVRAGGAGTTAWSTVGVKKVGGASYTSAAKKSSTGASSFSALGDSDDD